MGEIYDGSYLSENSKAPSILEEHKHIVDSEKLATRLTNKFLYNLTTPEEELDGYLRSNHLIWNDYQDPPGHLKSILKVQDFVNKLNNLRKY